MGIKQLKEIKRKDIPHKVRLKLAIKNRAFQEVASKCGKNISAEAFNNLDKNKEPDTVGVTLYHPNEQAPTHIMTKIFPLSVGEVEFETQVKKMQKELEGKIPKSEDK